MIIGMIDKAQGRDSPNNPFRLKRSSLSGSKKEEFRTVLSLLIPKRFTKSAFKPTRLKFLISHNPRGNTLITLKGNSVSHT
jgi:hypothetical protein